MGKKINEKVRAIMRVSCGGKLELIVTKCLTISTISFLMKFFNSPEQVYSSKMLTE